MIPMMITFQTLPGDRGDSDYDAETVATEEVGTSQKI
jgi:hypothetical protein